MRSVSAANWYPFSDANSRGVATMARSGLQPPACLQVCFERMVRNGGCAELGLDLVPIVVRWCRCHDLWRIVTKARVRLNGPNR